MPKEGTMAVIDIYVYGSGKKLPLIKLGHELSTAEHPKARWQGVEISEPSSILPLFVYVRQQFLCQLLWNWQEESHARDK